MRLAQRHGRPRRAFAFRVGACPFCRAKLRAPNGTIRTFSVNDAVETFPTPGSAGSKGAISAYYADSADLLHGFLTLLTAAEIPPEFTRNCRFHRCLRPS